MVKGVYVDKKETVGAPAGEKPRIAEMLTHALKSTPRIVENYNVAIESAKPKGGG